MSALSASPVNESDEVPAYRESFQSIVGEIRSLPKEQVQLVNAEIPATITTVMGALPKIRALRPRVLAELPTFPIDRFDKLETYAGALAHAHTVMMAESQAPGPVTELVEKCRQMSEVLLADTRALATRGVIDGSRLKDLKGNNSYRFIAFDVFTLVQILRENSDKIQGKTALEPGELERAQLLAEKLTRALGEREQAPAALETAIDNRDRAFTLFIKTYAEVQHAIYYLAPDEVDEIAPTIYVGGGRPTGRKKPPTPEAPADGGTPTTPAVTDTPVAPPGSSVPPIAVNPIPPGLPGASPFLRG